MQLKQEKEELEKKKASLVSDVDAIMSYLQGTSNTEDELRAK